MGWWDIAISRLMRGGPNRPPETVFDTKRLSHGTWINNVRKGGLPWHWVAKNWRTRQCVVSSISRSETQHATHMTSPVWTLLNIYNNAIRTCRIMSWNPVDTVEATQLQELIVHDSYSSKCFWTGSPSVDAARQIQRRHTNMPHHELKPCGRCGNDTTARIAFARHLLKCVLLNWVPQCGRCSMCKKTSRCEITRPPSSWDLSGWPYDSHISTWLTAARSTQTPHTVPKQSWTLGKVDAHESLSLSLSKVLNC